MEDVEDVAEISEILLSFDEHVMIFSRWSMHLAMPQTHESPIPKNARGLQLAMMEALESPPHLVV